MCIACVFTSEWIRPPYFLCFFGCEIVNSFYCVDRSVEESEKKEKMLTRNKARMINEEMLQLKRAASPSAGAFKEVDVNQSPIVKVKKRAVAANLADCMKKGNAKGTVDGNENAMLGSTATKHRRSIGNYNKMLEIESASGCAPNSEEFEYSICLTTTEIGEGVTLRNCLHSFCKECLNRLIVNEDSDEVKCPFISDAYMCSESLQDREIRSLLDETQYKNYLDKILRIAECRAEDAFHCQTPNCSGWFIVDSTITTFTCMVCNHLNCLKCKVQFLQFIHRFILVCDFFIIYPGILIVFSDRSSIQIAHASNINHNSWTMRSRRKQRSP